MTNMQIAIWLWWETSLHPACMSIVREVFGNNMPNKI
jgi:hypothetical protein